MTQFRGNDPSGHLVRLMISNWAFGWAVGFAVAGAVLISNVGGIRELMLRSDGMASGMVLLFGGFGLFFGGVVCATAVMLLPTTERNNSDESGGRGEPVLLPAYALARIRNPRR